MKVMASTCVASLIALMITTPFDHELSKWMLIPFGVSAAGFVIAFIWKTL
jgi:hypothetical protein